MVFWKWSVHIEKINGTRRKACFCSVSCLFENKCKSQTNKLQCPFPILSWFLSQSALLIWKTCKITVEFEVLFLLGILWFLNNVEKKRLVNTLDLLCIYAFMHFIEEVVWECNCTVARRLFSASNVFGYSISLSTLKTWIWILLWSQMKTRGLLSPPTLPSFPLVSCYHK